MRTLTHGTITHGKQFLDPDKQRWPTTYYGRNSGIGKAIAARRAAGGPLRLGVVGLGVGTLAAYAEEGDTVRIYELDPQVVDLAQREFTYLSGARGKVEIQLGDARLSMEREPAQQFDVLAVDAFSSDSIPVHLLTREAFAIYFRHMKPGGIVAVHISNRYLDLKPVLSEAARVFAKEARLTDTDDEDAAGTYGATWVLIADSADAFKFEGFDKLIEPLTAERKVRLWTDDFSDVYRILK
jgi:spermidine synthase